MAATAGSHQPRRGPSFDPWRSSSTPSSTAAHHWQHHCSSRFGSDAEPGSTGGSTLPADFSMADLAAPRAMFERLPAWGRRAAGPSKLLKRSPSMPWPACWPWWLGFQPIAMAAAWLHPLLRLLYIGAYVGNVPPLRPLLGLRPALQRNALPQASKHSG